MKKNKKNKIKEEINMDVNVNNENNIVTEETVINQNGIELGSESVEEVSNITEEVSTVEDNLINTETNIDESETKVEEDDESIQNEQESKEDEDTEIKVGRVTGCSKLYVRKEASKDSEPLCIIDGTVNVVVELDNSTEDFYKVITSEGIEGYCVREYISIE